MTRRSEGIEARILDAILASKETDKKALQAVLAVVEWPYRFLRSRLSHRRTVLFNVASPNYWTVLRPLFVRLVDDGRLSVWLTCPPGEEAHLHAAMADSPHWRGRIRLAPDVRWRRWDLYVDADHLSVTLMRPAKRIQTFHGGAPKTTVSGSNYSTMPFWRKYDRILCNSRRWADEMIRGGAVKNSRAAVCVGYPKLDRLVDDTISRDDVLRDYGVDPAGRTVLYAPSWNPPLSLHQIGQELIDTLSAGDWTLLVKPHPISCRLTPPGPDSSQWGLGHDWETFLDTRARNGQLLYVRDQDTCRYLTAADVLVTDYGSTLFEYMAIDRPTLYYDTTEANAVASAPEVLENIRKACHCFSIPQEAMDLLASGPPDVPGMNAARKALAEEHFFDIGGATDRAVAVVYELLNFLPGPREGRTDDRDLLEAV